MATNLLQWYARAALFAAIACILTQQPDNGAAMYHAALQSAGFRLGHGTFDIGSDTESHKHEVHLMVRLLLDHSLHYSKPGGYSEVAFRLVTDVGLKSAAALSDAQRLVVKAHMAQVIHSHGSWCKEFSPLLTR